MSIRTRITTRPENIHVHCEGKFSLENAKRDFVEVVNVMQRTGLAKVLVDGRDVTGQPEVLERFFYGDFVAGAVVKMLEQGFEGVIPQFAYVLEEPMLDRGRLGETVARNRGMNVKVFDNVDEAVEWLRLGDEESARGSGEPELESETEILP